MLPQFRKKKYLLEYLVKFKYRNSKEVLETKAYIYTTSRPKNSLEKLFPGVIILGYEATGERIDI